jgi:glutamate/aspartate transport system substrate-binding protein
MFRKGDAQLKKVVDATFFNLAQDRELEALYNRWFLRRLPMSQDRLDIAMSPQLETIFRAMGTAPE